MRDRVHRVLAIMAKGPRLGQVKTRLAPAYPADAIIALYRAFVEDTIDLGRSLDVSIVAVCPAADAAMIAEWLPTDVAVLPQRGVGLAAGLVCAFEELCTTEGRRVVAFNADSPHVGHAVLASAFEALITHDVVIGPSEDGGYYLVGATRSYPLLFDPAVMGKGSACEALLARTVRLGLTAARVPARYDVDVPADLLRLERELAEDPRRAPRTAAVLARWPIERERV